MSEQQGQPAEDDRQHHVLVVGPDGMAVAGGGADGVEQRSVTDMVEQPAKVMRIGNMVRQLLDEVKSAPLDDASRRRMREIHRASIKELEDGLSPELIEELEKLSLPFSDTETPSDAELRVAHAQLVGWLEGLFQGIQTAIYAQQMSARAQLEQMRRALPSGGGHPGMQGTDPSNGGEPAQNHSGGMYL
ncbi:bacterial proteasome activator family protein [soil metagenome]